MEQVKLTLAIIGVGLIGGSLGLCLKDKLGNDIYITGLCRTQSSMDKAMELGAVDFASNDIEAVVGSADIVFLSPPVLQIVPMVEKILPYLKKGAIITDAGNIVDIRGQNLLQMLPDILLGTAGIGDNRAFFQIGQYLFHHGHNLQHRRTQKDDICLLHHGFYIGGSKVHRPQFHRFVHGSLTAAQAGDVDVIPQLVLQAQPQGTADKPHADNREIP